ncbi:hypothetical protein Tco_0349850 [Tanacetum coccineum]
MSSSPHSTIIPFDSDINDDISPPQVIIALPAVLPPSPVLSLSSMFDSRNFFPFKKISSPKDTETPISQSVGSSSLIRSTTPPSDYPLISYHDMKPLGSDPDPEEPNKSNAC